MDTLLDGTLCPAYGPLFGFMGSAISISLACLGSAYGTAKAGVGVSSMGVNHPNLIMKCIIPVVMAGVLGIYGLIVAVIISSKMAAGNMGYSLFNGYAHLAAGVSCGLANLAAGFAIGIVGDAGVRGSALQPRLYVGMVLILIFAEALGLYGLIVAIILQAKQSDYCGGDRQ
eukprot:c8731_g1_i1.p1 GENE.c8731_g1_i1~~c8731_g1_i1.p1  ORF type:complete len:172 (+),score=70.36 c8731_g1_i1:84-599(+)